MEKINYTRLFAALILATCLTQVASDIYAPSMTAMAEGLKATIGQVQLSMSLYLLSVALSQLIYGPLSEGFGRKPVLIVGLIIMLVGSVLCAAATSIKILLLGRIIQGVGAGACTALWRSIFRDSFSGSDLAKYSAYLVTFVMFIVPSAPLLGGYLQQYFGWQANFIFMSAYAVIALLGIVFAFQESHSSFHLSKIHPAQIIASYATLCKSPIFMGVTLSTFLSYGAFFSWFVIGPDLLIHQLGMAPSTFGWWSFVGGALAYGVAGYLNGKLVKRLGPKKLMRFGWSVMLLASIMMQVNYLVFGLTVTAILLPVFIFYFGSTFIWPNAFATAFTPFGHIAGYAGALYGCMQVSGGALLAALIAYLPSHTQTTFASVIGVASLSAWLIYEKTTRNYQLP